MTESEVRQLMIAVARLEAKFDAMKEDIESLNKTRAWVISIVVGAVLLGLVGLLIGPTKVV